MLRVKRPDADFSPGIAYFPPPPRFAIEKQRWNKAVTSLAHWMTSTSLGLPKCTIPFWFMDPNSGVGMVDGQLDDDEHVGHFGAASQTLAADCIREMLAATDMVLINSFAPTGPMHFGADHDRQSKIDFIATPRKLFRAVVQCRN